MIVAGSRIQLDELRRRGYAWWIVEVLLDTGQRLQSSAMITHHAEDLATDMLGRMSTVLVTAINVQTAEALQELGANAWAAHGVPDDPRHRARRRRQIIAERLG